LTLVNLKNNYFLLLVDIRNSTGLPGKAMNEKMKLLEETLLKLNKEFSNQTALPLSISYGDEIAGLFHSPEKFYNIIIRIQKLFYPLTNIRFAAVKGKISMESKDIRKVGGPIFKKASNAIANLKETGRYASWQLGNTIQDKSLESLCEISNALINDMSDYQRKVFDLLSAGHTQKEIAKELGKYTQSVWDAVQRSKAVYVINAQKTINLILATGK
jgi:hypothetical protein